MYVSIVSYYAISRWAKFYTLEPSALGDFIGGVLGPLALLWLICGYLQQGIELRQNTEALMLQAEELRSSTRALEHQVEELGRSVEQQTQLAGLARQQLEIEVEKNRRLLENERIQNSPDLQVVKYKRYAEHAPAMGEITVRNAGAGIAILGIKSNGSNDKFPQPSFLETGSDFTVQIWRQGETRDRVSIELRFRAMSGKQGSYEISLRPDSQPSIVLNT